MQRPRPRRNEADAASIPPTLEQIRERTFQHAAKLLAGRPRSIADLRARLLQGRQTNSAAVEAVIARLREYGYLDDARFAFGYASLKVKQRPIGRRRLQRDLMFKKVNREVADGALDLVYAETSEEELVDRAIQKRLRLRGRPKGRTEAKKLIDHLLQQGFSFELVAERVRAVAQANADEVD